MQSSTLNVPGCSFPQFRKRHILQHWWKWVPLVRKWAARVAVNSFSRERFWINTENMYMERQHCLTSTSLIICGAFYVICGTFYVICGAFYIICGAFHIICGAFVIICGTSVMVCSAFVVIWGAFVIICGTFVIICSAFVVVCGGLVIIGSSFYIICGALFVIIIWGAFVVIVMIPRDLGRNRWKIHNAMGTDIQDPPLFSAFAPVVFSWRHRNGHSLEETETRRSDWEISNWTHYSGSKFMLDTDYC